MAAAAKAHVPLTVALLGRSDGARELLRHALEDLGAEVVFEGDPAGLPPEQVMRSGAQVVLVNLASGVEDDIDHLQPLFDDATLAVIGGVGHLIHYETPAEAAGHIRVFIEGERA